MDMARVQNKRVLPLELEEALESNRPVLLDYVDGFGTRTERIVQPLHVRRRMGQLMLIAHCALRNDQRTFKLDRVVRMAPMDMPPLVIPPKVKRRGGARIYDPPQRARIYEAIETPELFPSLSQRDIEATAGHASPQHLTIPLNPS